MSDYPCIPGETRAYKASVLSLSTETAAKYGEALPGDEPFIIFTLHQTHEKHLGAIIPITCAEALAVEILQRAIEHRQLPAIQQPPKPTRRGKTRPEVEPRTAIGARIRSLRKARGLTIAEFATLATLNYHTAWTVETQCSIPSGPTLSKMAQALNLPVEELTALAETDLAARKTDSIKSDPQNVA